MTQFKAFAPGVEVNGETVLAFINGMGPFRNTGLEILAQHGIRDPQPGAWYPQQAWLDAFRQVAEKMGPGTLLAIGKSIPEAAQWPPQVDTLEKALASIDVAYHLNHRGGEIGHYAFESTGPRSARVTCQNPYPSDFDLGIVSAVARRFAPPGKFPAVKLDETAPTRKKGAEACTYLITW